MNASQKGLTLITAIFLLVVVAALGTFMVTIGSTQRQSSALSILGARALYAADGGMEWSVATVLGTNACFASPTTFTLGGGALKDYSVTNTCASTGYTEGADSYIVFRLSTTATHGSLGSADYISRSVRSSVTTAP